MGFFSRLMEVLRPRHAEMKRLQSRAEETLQESATYYSFLRDLEGSGYDVSVASFDREMTVADAKKIAQIARSYYLANPMCRRAVELLANYTFGLDVTVKSSNAKYDRVVRRFWTDPSNKLAFTSHQALMQRERELFVDGNVFFMFFVKPDSGAVRVRPVPFAQVEDVLPAEGDRFTQQFYLVRDSDGKVFAHPDWRYRPPGQPSSVDVGGQRVDVKWLQPVLHVRVGSFGDWKVGCSELSPVISWARAWSNLLTDHATLKRAHARFAWVYEGMTSATEKTNVTSAFGSSIPSSVSGAETSPSPATGSILTLPRGRTMQPVKTSGATTSPEESRHIRLMIGAGTGWGDHVLSSDLSQGTLATAQSMDRPAELRVRDRQALWANVIKDVLTFVLLCAMEAPGGALSSSGVVYEDDTFYFEDADAFGISADFPPVISDGVRDMIAAITDAATLSGRVSASTMTRETLSRQLLNTLGVENVEQEIKLLRREWAKQDEAAASSSAAAATPPAAPEAPAAPAEDDEDEAEEGEDDADESAATARAAEEAARAAQKTAASPHAVAGRMLREIDCALSQLDASSQA